MRKTARLGVLLLAGVATVLVGVVPAAATTPVHPNVPTCLISNGGHYSKVLTCVQLVNERYGSAGSGRYSAGPGSGQHSLTVTVEYRKSGYGHNHATWVTMASASQHGRGNLMAMTRPAWAPRSATMRACVTVSGGMHRQGSELCTTP
ncbi:MAG TPA: hypothetical protein VFX16_34210 [Pseudonocardiaceae bacterium]|nr:hypothetical protein [Pseudonocardiaceae bacterium]